MTVVDYLKKKIQDNVSGFYYSMISNILRSTIIPYRANKKKYFNYKENFFHPEVTIDTIGLCNARCTFCSYRISDRPKEIISIEKYKNWADQAKKLGFSRLNLTPINGEFFLNKDYAEIIKFSRVIGFKKVRTFTNALNFDKIDLKNILDKDYGLTSLSISTGGFEKKNYEECFGIKKYDKFLKNLITILEYFEKFRPSTNLSIELRSNKSFKENINTPDFINHINKFYKKKIFVIEQINYFDSWAGQIMQKDLPLGMKLGPKPIIQKRLCHRMYTLGILYDGVVRLCNCRYQGGDITQDGLYLGNLNNQELSSILDSNLVEEIRSNFSSKKPAVCNNCQFYIPTILS